MWQISRLPANPLRWRRAAIPQWKLGIATVANNRRNLLPRSVKFQAAAEQGDRDAQFELGLIYQGGRGVPQDKDEAQQWLTQAAQKGHGRAQYALALLYREQGADISQSLKWQRQTAQSGYAEAQYGMGLLYANGQYLQQDKTQARFGLNKLLRRPCRIAFSLIIARWRCAYGGCRARTYANSGGNPSGTRTRRTTSSHFRTRSCRSTQARCSSSCSGTACGC